MCVCIVTVSLRKNLSQDCLAYKSSSATEELQYEESGDISENGENEDEVFRCHMVALVAN